MQLKFKTKIDQSEKLFSPFCNLTYCNTGSSISWRLGFESTHHISKDLVITNNSWNRHTASTFIHKHVATEDVDEDTYINNNKLLLQAHIHVTTEDVDEDTYINNNKLLLQAHIHVTTEDVDEDTYINNNKLLLQAHIHVTTEEVDEDTYINNNKLRL